MLLCKHPGVLALPPFPRGPCPLGSAQLARDSVLGKKHLLVCLFFSQLSCAESAEQPGLGGDGAPGHLKPPSLSAPTFFLSSMH